MKRYNKKKFKKKKIDVLKDCAYMWLDEALTALMLTAFAVFGIVKIAM